MYVPVYEKLKISFDDFLEKYSRENLLGKGKTGEAAHYSLNAGGKRIRPVLLLLVNETLGGDIGDALPAALSLEMVHTYSLIHDDLPAMDDDDFRRGKPSCHAKFGEAAAILAGDALLTEAFALLASSGASVPAAVSLQLLSELGSAAGLSGMVLGQDMDMDSNGIRTAGELAVMHGLKTGRLMEYAVAAGGIINSSDSAFLDLLREYGRHLGLAFQIKDDLLDLSDNTVILGKTPGKDREKGKATFPLILGEKAAVQRYREETEEINAVLEKMAEKVSVDGLKKFTENILARVN